MTSVLRAASYGEVRRVVRESFLNVDELVKTCHELGIQFRCSGWLLRLAGRKPPDDLRAQLKAMVLPITFTMVLAARTHCVVCDGVADIAEPMNEQYYCRHHLPTSDGREALRLAVEQCRINESMAYELGLASESAQPYLEAYEAWANEALAIEAQLASEEGRDPMPIPRHNLYQVG